MRKKSKTVKKTPIERYQDIDWNKFGPKAFIILQKALKDHDSGLEKLPFDCTSGCWSYEARKLIED